MQGRHASEDLSRFRRDRNRLLLLGLAALLVAAGAVLIARALSGRSDIADQASPPVTEPTNDISEATPTTQALGSTTTMTIPTTTAAPTTTVPPEPTTTLQPVQAPESLTVLVLNSTQVAGLAGRLTDRLSLLGYRTLEASNHPTPLDVSVVWYIEGFEREAGVLSESIPDANLEPFAGDDPQAHLTVVLGASYRE